MFFYILDTKKISDAVGKPEITSSIIIAIILGIVSSLIIAFGVGSTILGVFSVMRSGRGGLVALGIILFIVAWLLAIFFLLLL